MDAQATNGSSRGDAAGDRYETVGEQWENIVWGGTADGGERPPANPVGEPPARRQDGLSQDGQLVEAGYGHGV